MFCRKRLSLLTGLKVSYLAYKCVFYRQEHYARRIKFESLEIQKENMPIDRNQRVGEKNGIICFVIMFTPSAIVIKISKMAHFFYFLTAKDFYLMTAKN